MNWRTASQEVGKQELFLLPLEEKMEDNTILYLFLLMLGTLMSASIIGVFLIFMNRREKRG